jgi:hypothetical protein
MIHSVFLFSQLNDAYKRQKEYIQVRPTKFLIKILNYLVKTGYLVGWSFAQSRSAQARTIIGYRRIVRPRSSGASREPGQPQITHPVYWMSNTLYNHRFPQDDNPRFTKDGNHRYPQDDNPRFTKDGSYGQPSVGCGASGGEDVYSDAQTPRSVLTRRMTKVVRVHRVQGNTLLRGWCKSSTNRKTPCATVYTANKPFGIEQGNTVIGLTSNVGSNSASRHMSVRYLRRVRAEKRWSAFDDTEAKLRSRRQDVDREHGVKTTLPRHRATRRFADPARCAHEHNRQAVGGSARTRLLRSRSLKARRNLVPNVMKCRIYLNWGKFFYAGAGSNSPIIQRNCIRSLCRGDQVEGTSSGTRLITTRTSTLPTHSPSFGGVYQAQGGCNSIIDRTPATQHARISSALSFNFGSVLWGEAIGEEAADGLCGDISVGHSTKLSVRSKSLRRIPGCGTVSVISRNVMGPWSLEQETSDTPWVQGTLRVARRIKILWRPSRQLSLNFSMQKGQPLRGETNRRTSSTPTATSVICGVETPHRIDPLIASTKGTSVPPCFQRTLGDPRALSARSTIKPGLKFKQILLATRRGIESLSSSGSAKPWTYPVQPNRGLHPYTPLRSTAGWGHPTELRRVGLGSVEAERGLYDSSAKKHGHISTGPVGGFLFDRRVATCGLRLLSEPHVKRTGNRCVLLSIPRCYERHALQRTAVFPKEANLFQKAKEERHPRMFLKGAASLNTCFPKDVRSPEGREQVQIAKQPHFTKDGGGCTQPEAGRVGTPHRRSEGMYGLGQVIQPSNKFSSSGQVQGQPTPPQGGGGPDTPASKVGGVCSDDVLISDTRRTPIQDLPRTVRRLPVRENSGDSNIRETSSIRELSNNQIRLQRERPKQPTKLPSGAGVLVRGSSQVDPRQVGTRSCPSLNNMNATKRRRALGGILLCKFE